MGIARLLEPKQKVTERFKKLVGIMKKGEMVCIGEGVA